jgi:pSer/pThr/pTyr-binding forkhead associated (FHA) protein
MDVPEKPQPKICPRCQHENSAEAIHCAKCDATLESTTTIDMLNGFQLADPQLPVSVTPKPGLFTFYIPGFDKPLQVPTKDLLLIGRHQEGHPAPDVNLNPYHGYAAGVSRNHAQIKALGMDMILEDLGSSNGTWLNERKLTPYESRVLRNGDILRLGHLLMFVYFKPAEVAEQTLLLRETKGGLNGTVGTSSFSKGLLNFLTAIEDLQKFINALMSNDAEVHIKNVSLDKERGVVQVKIVGAEKAILFAQTTLAERKRQLANGQSSAEATFEDIERHVSPEVLNQAIGELTETLLTDLSNWVSPEKKADYQQILNGLIRTLFISSIEIVSA